MALKTYVGSYEQGVEVRVLCVSYGVVKPGESIVVPDELAEKVKWPEEIWTDGPSTNEKGNDKE